MPPTSTALALSGVSIVRTTGAVARNGSATRAYGAGLVHEPKSSSASLRASAGSKSPTIASSAFEAP